MGGGGGASLRGREAPLGTRDIPPQHTTLSHEASLTRTRTRIHTHTYSGLASSVVVFGFHFD